MPTLWLGPCKSHLYGKFPETDNAQEWGVVREPLENQKELALPFSSQGHTRTMGIWPRDDSRTTYAEYFVLWGPLYLSPSS